MYQLVRHNKGVDVSKLRAFAAQVQSFGAITAICITCRLRWRNVSDIGRRYDPRFTIYLAQLRCPDGGLPMTCADPVPQKASDMMSWRRWDGLDQYEDSVVSNDGAYWITT